MMTANDIAKKEFCQRTNGGYCLFKVKKCDGLCNNCGIDVTRDEATPYRNCKPSLVTDSSTVEYVPNTEFYMNYPI